MRTAEAVTAHSPVVSKRVGTSGSLRFDWAMAGFGILLIGGVFLDGWAHIQRDIPDTPFTPWHAVLYSGFLAGALFLANAARKNLARGLPLRRVVPAGYELSLLGAAIFALGGIGDMAWHFAFGIETGVDALYSPTHLALALGGILMASGPLRSAWRREDRESAPGWAGKLPMLLSLTTVLSSFTFFTLVAHPFVTPQAGGAAPRTEDLVLLHQALGVTEIVLQTTILMGLVLLATRRWVLPFGSLTLVFGLNAVAMHFLDVLNEYQFIPAAVLAGLGADLLYRWLRPGPGAERAGQLRWFAAAVPALLYLTYFMALLATRGVWWSIHLWTGSIVLAGIVGWLLSYLLAPPPLPELRPERS
ncbi:MAG: hypothetical protein ACRDJF_04515 [Actinomycetota bacterium]